MTAIQYPRSHTQHNPRCPISDRCEFASHRPNFRIPSTIITLRRCLLVIQTHRRYAHMAPGAHFRTTITHIIAIRKTETIHRIPLLIHIQINNVNTNVIMSRQYFPILRFHPEFNRFLFPIRMSPTIPNATENGGFKNSTSIQPVLGKGKTIATSVDSPNERLSLTHQLIPLSMMLIRPILTLRLHIKPVRCLAL